MNAGAFNNLYYNYTMGQLFIKLSLIRRDDAASNELACYVILCYESEILVFK